MNPSHILGQGNSTLLSRNERAGTTELLLSRMYPNVADCKIFNIIHEIWFQVSAISLNLLRLLPSRTGQPACRTRESGARDLCTLGQITKEPFTGLRNTLRKGNTV